jgi:hypothetical protein
VYRAFQSIGKQRKKLNVCCVDLLDLLTKIFVRLQIPCPGRYRQHKKKETNNEWLLEAYVVGGGHSFLVKCWMSLLSAR